MPRSDPFYARHTDYGGAVYNAKAHGLTGATSQRADTLLADLIELIQGENEGRGTILLPHAFGYLFEAPLVVPAGFRIIGEDARVLVPSGADFAALDIDGASDVRLTGLRGGLASGAAVAGSALVRIRGAASDVVIERVTGVGFGRGFDIAGATGTTPGTVRRVTLRSCGAHESPTTFGFNIDDADTILLDDCHGRDNWLDGAKLRKLTKNVTVRGGAFTGNGVGFLTDPVLYAGDGMDAYAGGDTFVVEGTIFDSNYGQGITVKTGPLNEDDPTNFGYVKNVQLIGLRCRLNDKRGLYLTVSTPAEMTEPVPSCVVVLGGQFEGNVNNGIYVNARNTTLVSPMCRGNGEHGIVTAARAFDVRIVDPQCINNGVSSANAFDNINIQGTRIRVTGGTYIGADADTVAVDGDYAALTKNTARAVRVASTAVDVVLDLRAASIAHHAQSVPVRCDMTSGVCVIHHPPRTGDPLGAGAYGSIGSTWIRSDATTTEDIHWVKAGGAPNGVLADWKRACDATSMTARSNADATIGMAASRTQRLAVALTADRTVTLPTTSLYVGARFRFVRTAASTGAFNWSIGGLKNLATGQWCDVMYDGTAWFLTAFGSL